MANPNIVNVATINGKTDVFALTTTSANLVTAAANTVNKINTILISNIDGTNAANVTVNYYDGSNSRAIANIISVPAQATLELIGKNTSFYIEENEKIQAFAGANSDLECLVSYDVIAD
ncbi:hypothetical protein [Thalassospira sp.]|jgi:hypothetical protein|uniref:hypothetical protein n=1 Tax=Thalassospira sp. TaxID=1912094 RepID=UPI0025FC7EBE|nr:hypothetical protein [Thalassospira sp.]|tara:strand:+ start:1924 stop:2280 length:357 start_codon:yes stop_codon:yes gene_type:complete